MPKHSQGPARVSFILCPSPDSPLLQLRKHQHVLCELSTWLFRSGPSFCSFCKYLSVHYVLAALLGVNGTRRVSNSLILGGKIGKK